MTLQEKWIVEEILLHACCRSLPATDKRRSDVIDTESPTRLSYNSSKYAGVCGFWLLLAGISFRFLATAMIRAQLMSKGVVALQEITSID